MKKSMALSLLVLAVAAVPAMAQIGQKKKEADPRVAALLDKAELKYEVDKDGDYRLINKFDDDRTQLVFVFSKTFKLGEMEIREVSSVGYLADETIPPEVLKNLLEENGKVKLGAWELGRFSGKEAGVFRAKIAADTDVKTLLMALQAVSQTADEKEKELLKSDEL